MAQGREHAFRQRDFSRISPIQMKSGSAVSSARQRTPHGQGQRIAPGRVVKAHAEPRHAEHGDADPHTGAEDDDMRRSAPGRSVSPSSLFDVGRFVGLRWQPPKTQHVDQLLGEGQRQPEAAPAPSTAAESTAASHRRSADVVERIRTPHQARREPREVADSSVAMTRHSTSSTSGARRGGAAGSG